MISYSKLRKLKVEIADARDASDDLDARITADDSVAFTDLTDTPTQLKQVYYQATAPSHSTVACVASTIRSGDYWIDSDDNKMYLSDGSTWTEIQDFSGDISAVQSLIDDIADDAKITAVEKLTLKPVWDAIVTEAAVTTGTLIVQAAAFSVSDTDFAAAYAALYGYIITSLDVFNSMSATTTIVRSTWDGHWNLYWDERTNLINDIEAAAKVLADNAQGDATTAISNAATAQAAAEAAQADADTGIADAATAQALLDDIAADDKITPIEKLTLKPMWDAIITEATLTTGTIVIQAAAFSVADTDFDNAYAALYGYIITSLDVFGTMTATTTITRSTWDGHWNLYYDERTNLLNDIAAAAKALADQAQSDATQALADAATAISNAATAQGTADGKVTTFYQDGVPTAEGAGDLWIDTNDGNKLYRATATGDDQIGGGEWIEIQDDAIATAISNAATAQTTADGKIVTFYQDAVPTATDAGDLWYDTNDGNKLYRATAEGDDQVGGGEWIEVAANLDNVSDGTTYSRVATTAISGGKIVLTTDGVTGTLAVGLTEAKNTNALADQTSANPQNLSWLTGSAGTLTISSTGSLEISAANALAIKSTGGMIVEAGAGVTFEDGTDITMESATGDDAGVIYFVSENVTYGLAANYDEDNLCLWPDTIDTGTVFIGFDQNNGGIKPFDEVDIFASGNVNIEIRDVATGASNQYLRMDTDSCIMHFDTVTISGAFHTQFGLRPTLSNEDVGSSANPYQDVFLYGNITMADTTWVGVGSSSARIRFNHAGGQVEIQDGRLYLDQLGGDEGGEIFFEGGDNGAGTDYDDVTLDSYQNGLRIFTNSANDGGLTINNSGSGTFNVWIKGDCSALTFTDRSNFYAGNNAITELKKVRQNPNSKIGDWAKIDHNSLPDGTKSLKDGVAIGRDIGATLSLLLAQSLNLKKELLPLKNKEMVS